MHGIPNCNASHLAEANGDKARTLKPHSASIRMTPLQTLLQVEDSWGVRSSDFRVYTLGPTGGFREMELLQVPSGSCSAAAVGKVLFFDGVCCESAGAGGLPEGGGFSSDGGLTGGMCSAAGNVGVGPVVRRSTAGFADATSMGAASHPAQSPRPEEFGGVIPEDVCGVQGLA